MKTRNIVLLLMALAVAIVTYGLVSSGAAAKLLPVSPVVVSARDSADKSKLTDYIATIITDIRNDGGAGDVVIEVAYTEGSQTWTRSDRQRFGANETKTVSFDFPEATLGGKGAYAITAR